MVKSSINTHLGKFRSSGAIIEAQDEHGDIIPSMSPEEIAVERFFPNVKKENELTSFEYDSTELPEG